MLILLLGSCNRAEKNVTPPEKDMILQSGEWLLTLDLGDELLPVNLVVRQEGSLEVDFINAKETITAYEFIQFGDSLFLRMPLFDSEFCGVIEEGGERYTGLWRNYAKNGEYAIPFSASYGHSARFCSSYPSQLVFDDQYRVVFSGSTEDEYSAIGLFEGEAGSNRITGTFITETGDYRYLEGNICNEQLKLSCFDGSHAFLFSAHVSGDSLINGVFKSGKHWVEPWVAHSDHDFHLRDPNSLTIIQDSSQVWQTKVYDMEGNEIILAEMGLEEKAVIVQVLGSWCPNCIDESIAYKAFYDKYNSQGLEIIPITFENTSQIGEAHQIITELRSDLSLPYEIYYGGKKSKAAASKALPSLNHIMSFPTSIFIGRDGEVKKVHTGFYGPSTKHFYDMWLHDTEILIEELLKEA